MKVELVKMYPLSKSADNKKYVCSYHILVSGEMHIRGCVATKSPKGIKCTLPYKTAICAETGKKITYTIHCYDDLEKQKEFIEKAVSLGKAEMKSLLDDPKSLSLFQLEKKKDHKKKFSKPSNNDALKKSMSYFTPPARPKARDIPKFR